MIKYIFTLYIIQRKMLWILFAFINQIFSGRLLVLEANENLGVNYKVPNVQQRVMAVLDTNHKDMVDSGLYNLDQVTAFKDDYHNYFYEQFGLNFSQAIENPPGTGILNLPPFQLVPYHSGQDKSISISFDSAHQFRRFQGWYGEQHGVLVVPMVSGSFAKGIHARETFEAYDVLTYFNYDLIGPLGYEIQREIITVMSPWPGRSVLNSQGYGDFFAKLVAVDSLGHESYYFEGITLLMDLNTNITYSKTRVVVTW